MRNGSTKIVTAMAAALLVTLTACATDDSSDQAADPASAEPTPELTQTPASPEPMAEEESPAAQDMGDAAPAIVAGSYISYNEYNADPAAYENGDVVLFFNASWCPTCQAANANLESEPVPDGLTVVSVDYDSNGNLRQQYGVTVQHTYVQIGPDGEEMTKFTGSNSAAEIQDQLV